MTHITKKRCDRCSRHFRHLKECKGKTLCYFCYMKEADIIWAGPYIPTRNGGRMADHLEDAQKKSRSVLVYPDKNGSPRCLVSVPSCFAGKKVRVTVMEDK